jgi:hypothetical protein
VASVLGDPAKRQTISVAMAALGRPGAARAIVDELERMAPAPTGAAA